MSVIKRSMEVFYDTCGYRDEFKQIIAKLAQDTFEDHVKAIVADAFSSDLDANKHLDAAEFVAWSGANKMWENGSTICPAWCSTVLPLKLRSTISNLAISHSSKKKKRM